MSKMDTIETSFKHMLSFKARIKSQITDDTGSCFEYPEISSIGEIYTSLAQKMRYSLPKPIMLLWRHLWRVTYI